MTTFLSTSLEETFAWGLSLGRKLKAGQVICFYGELGAGKTTLIKAIAEGAAEVSPHEVNSPTYVYLNIYEGTKTIYHFDLYRLGEREEFLGMGFDEYLHGNGICCIEWAECIKDLLPKNTLSINIQHQGEYRRALTLEGNLP